MRRLTLRLTDPAEIETPLENVVALFLNEAGTLSVKDENGDVEALERPATGQRVHTFASSASYAPDFDTYDFINITALAEAISFGAPTGSPDDAARMIMRIKDDGTQRAITWNAAYFDGGVGLPSATTAGKVSHLGFIYYAALSKWALVAAITQP